MWRTIGVNVFPGITTVQWELGERAETDTRVFFSRDLCELAKMREFPRDSIFEELRGWIYDRDNS